MAKTTSTNSVSKPSPAKKTVGPRRLKAPRYHSFSLQRSIRPEKVAVIGGFKLARKAFESLRYNWKAFSGITIIYALLTLVLMPIMSGNDVNNSKSSVDAVLTGPAAPVAGSLSVFTYMLAKTGGVDSQAAGVYRVLLVLTVSLALIWTLRQTYLKKRVRIRDGFYGGMAPLVPFLLVLLVVILELLPLAIGSYIYTIASSGASGPELVLWGVMIFLLGVLSFYMVCSSIFALYIVCLPGMQPVAALRSAVNIVRYRRWLVMRRVLFLPLLLLLLALVLLLPFILFFTAIAGWVLALCTILMVPLLHAYMYTLYRELLP